MIDADEIFEGLKLPPLKAAGAKPGKRPDGPPRPLILDRSGSMQSDSMAIAKFFFLLSLLHSRAKHGRH